MRIWDGNNWVHVAKRILGITKDTVQAKGDLIVGSAPEEVDRLPVGQNGQILVADSSAPLGVRWENPTSPPSEGGIILSLLLQTDIQPDYGIVMFSSFINNGPTLILDSEIG
jgi:hypothetical protein